MEHRQIAKLTVYLLIMLVLTTRTGGTAQISINRCERVTKITGGITEGSAVIHRIPGEWAAGNCRMKDAMLIIQADGNAIFEASVKTTFTHGKDIWHQSWQGATQLDANGTPKGHWWEHGVDSEKLSEKDKPIWHRFHDNWKVDPKHRDVIFWIACC